MFHQGVRRYVVCGTLGIGLWSAECARQLKLLYKKKVELVCVIPFEGHDANWDPRSRDRLAKVRRQADSVVYAMSLPGSGAMERTWLRALDEADIAIVIADGAADDRNMIDLMRRIEIKSGKVIRIHPDTGKVWEPERLRPELGEIEKARS